MAIPFNFSPRRLFSPIYIISFLFVVVILFNFLYFASDTLPSLPKSALHDATFQSIVDSLDREEYIKKLIKELKEAKQEELLNKLEEEIHSENMAGLKAKLLKEVEGNFTEAFKKDLKQRIDKDYSKSYGKEAEMSLTVFDELKAKYLSDNFSEIKQTAMLDVFREMDIKVSLPSDFDAKVAEHHKKFSKSNFYSNLITNYLVKYKPTVDKLSESERGNSFGGQYIRDVQLPPLTRKRLTEDRVNLPKEKFENLQQKHDELVKALKRMGEPPKEFVNGDGIVISGGGTYFGSALVAIGQMREMGAKLPIELIINSEAEYDKQICEELLPKQFNAKCIVIEREVGKDVLDSLKLSKFQMKIFGLLFTTFDNIVTIDADNMPIKNVDTLLYSEPYLTSKFILWPDIWHKCTSPLFYDIARFKQGHPTRRQGIANDWSWFDYVKKDPETEISFHDFEGISNPISIETGQMVFSKRAHFRSFMLALYYNIYGPDFYYRLLFQGTFGEGDRETFVPALDVFHEPYHIVEHDTWLAGFKYDEGKGFQETTIVQYDPTQNEKFFEDWQKWLRGKKLDDRMWPFQSNLYTQKLLEEFQNSFHKEYTKLVENPLTGKMDEKHIVENFKKPDIFFFHIHNPKINPIENAKHGKDNIYSRRNLGLPGAYEDFGTTDWELQFHTISKWIACKGITSPHFWKEVAKEDQKKVCDTVTKYTEFLMKDSQDKSAADLKYLKF